MTRAREITPERLTTLLTETPGLNTQQIARALHSSSNTAQKAVRRACDSGLLIRSGDSSQGDGYRYTLNLHRGPEADPEAGISPQARAARRAIRQLARPTAPLLASRYGCSYPVAHRLLAELQAAGLVAL